MDNRADNNADVNVNTDVVAFRVSHQHPHVSTSHTSKFDPAVTLATSESVLPQDEEYGFIVDFLNGFKPFAIRLREANMPHNFTFPSAPPTPPPSRSALSSDTAPKAKVPSFATRRAACTHLTMERLYGDVECNICSRSSNFGWVYCCTQDYVSESPLTSDSISEISTPPHQHVNGSGDVADVINDVSMPSSVVDEEARLGGEDTLMPTPELSPWIEKAIKDGHYTAEQIVKLRAQKQHVVDTAHAAIHQFEQSQTKSTNSPPQTPTTLQSVDANPHLPISVINEVREPSATSLSTAKVTLPQQAKTRMFPLCKFCACQLCRPGHRERAWQHFGDIFETEHEIPFIHYEDINRPLASRSIMSTIGLHPPPLPQRPLLRSSGSRCLHSHNEAGRVSFNNKGGSYRKSADPTSSATDIADVSVEADSKGFRDSMKRAFKNMLITRQTSSRSKNSRRGARKGTDTTEADAVEFDMGLWRELNDELLKEASGVPLPEKNSLEGLSKEVASMSLKGVGGVAVTEEAASLGTPDVIMSV